MSHTLQIIFESRAQQEGDYRVTARCSLDEGNDWIGSFEIDRICGGLEPLPHVVQTTTVVGGHFHHGQDALNCALQFGLRRARDVLR